MEGGEGGGAEEISPHVKAAAQKGIETDRSSNICSAVPNAPFILMIIFGYIWVNGAAAPEEPMTYASMMTNFFYFKDANF